MSSKLHTAILNQYSQTYSQKVCDNFYSKQSTISGQQLLQLTNIPQINFFIMGSLYEKWKTDAEAFKSPYFNFESENVKNALQTFMNVVSQNISVKREHLEPFLTDATKNTLSLLLDTQNHFNDIFRSQPNFTLSVESLKQILKYTRINQFIPQTIASNMGERSFVYSNQAITWLDETIEQLSDKLEPADSWVSKFSEIVPLHLDEILKKPLKVVPLPPIVPEEKEEKSFFDTIPEIETKAPISIAPEKEPVTVSIKEPSTVSINEAQNLEASLNDSLRNGEESMAQSLQNKLVKNISDSIPLHQKFMFIHQLFGGSNSSYETTISDLESAPNYESAYQMIIYQFASKYSWDITGEAVTELIDVVKRKFS